jgi:hypothetical protein
MRAATSILAVALGLIGCASRAPSPWPPGIALLDPSAPRVHLPSALPVRAEASGILRSKGRTLHFDAVLLADSAQGRLEAFGPFGIPLATVDWTDTTWMAWLPSQSILLKGTGDSLALPVLGLRSLRPRELLGAWLGRPLPIRSGIPLRSIGSTGPVTGLVPAVPSPSWSATLDRRTGLPAALQVLRGGVEVEKVRFAGWHQRVGAMVPDTLVRTTPRGDELRLVVRTWTTVPQSQVGPTLPLPEGIDTILVERDGASRLRYLVRPALAPDGSGDPTPPTDPLDLDEPSLETDPDAATDDDQTESVDPDDSLPGLDPDGVPED